MGVPGNLQIKTGLCRIKYTFGLVGQQYFYVRRRSACNRFNRVRSVCVKNYPRDNRLRLMEAGLPDRGESYEIHFVF